MTGFDFLTREFNAVLMDKSLHGKGLHRTYLIDFNAGKAEVPGPKPAVVKCFGPRGGAVNVFLRSAVNFVTGRSAVFTRTRYNIERKVIATWQKYGFGTFKIINELPEAFRGKPWLVTEFAGGVTLDCVLADKSVDDDSKAEIMAHFWRQTAQRHNLALVNNQRLLIPSHPNLKHVMLMPDGAMLTFDFEVAFVRFVSVKTLIGRELAGYARSMARVLNPNEFALALKLMVQNYPQPDYLDFVARVDKSSNPLIRLFQVFGKRLGKKDRSGKLNAANAILKAKKEYLCK